MKKLVQFIILSFLIFSSVSAETRNNELNNLFKLLKNSENTKAIEIENKIWKIWITHPSEDRRGYRLTELLAQGSLLINQGELNKAYGLFSQIILEDPKWAEAWNKRATVLYIMGNYEQSQNDINEVLKLEERHFGALSGQGLVQIKLKNYQKAIESYKEVEKLYPSMEAPKVMICLLYTSPSPRDGLLSRMPSSA